MMYASALLIALLTQTNFLPANGAVLDTNSLVSKHNLPVQPLKINDVPRPFAKASNLTILELYNLTPQLISRSEQSINTKTRTCDSYNPLAKVEQIKNNAYDRLLNIASYPFSPIGLIQNWDGDDLLSSCTGTLVGPNLLLTASHCIPWDTAAADGKWSLQFLANFDLSNPADSDPLAKPYGLGWATHCIGVAHRDDLKLWGLDYAVCQLSENLGDYHGWMDHDSSQDNDFYRNCEWMSVGYPLSVAIGVPIFEERIKINWVEDSGPGGKQVESMYYSEHGWSGGPLFQIIDGNPTVIGVVSAEIEPMVGDGIWERHTLHAGGNHMSALIEYGKQNWAL